MIRSTIAWLILVSFAYGQKADELEKYVSDLNYPRYSVEDHTKAAAYVYDKCIDSKINVIYQQVGKFRNVVAWIPGQEGYYLIGAHLDTVARSPGADDNASGSAAVLGLARRFSKLPTPSHTLVFVWFCSEEQGMVGSRYYCKNPQLGKIEEYVFMINFDMIGRLKGDVKRYKGDMSDHASFRNEMKVTWFFTGTHSDYHRSTDTADKINYKGMETICQVAYLLIRETVTIPWPNLYGRN